MSRLIKISLLTAALTLVTNLAFADQLAGGEGLYGPTNDKVVTFTGFIVIGFFVLLITILSIIQAQLEKRKEAKIEAEKRRRKRAQWHGGW